MSYYHESVGEIVSQVYEIDASNWEEAKKTALPDMAVGDILAECPSGAVKKNETYPEYRYIEKDECNNYTELLKGTWATNSDGAEYWEERAWHFSDNDNAYYNANGEEFTDWQ